MPSNFSSESFDSILVTIRLTIRLTIRFDDLDSMSDDLEQVIDDLDYTSISFT